jgi:hypothetical protein
MISFQERTTFVRLCLKNWHSALLMQTPRLGANTGAISAYGIFIAEPTGKSQALAR